MLRFKLWLQQLLFAKHSLILLYPFSYLYAVAIYIRRLLYKLKLLPSFKLAVPVIVVGNITVGGTGKTPVVIYLANKFSAMGLKPGIVTRGYKRKNNLDVEAYSDTPTHLVGDEAVVLARNTNCPVMVGNQRVIAAQKLLQKYPTLDLIIADDGLQHYALKRDVEIIVLDSARGLGNGRMLPAGPLRESTTKLKESQFIVSTNQQCSHTNYHYARKFSDCYYNLDPNKVIELNCLQNKTVDAIAGIGNPQAFFKMLKEHGLDVVEHPFPDHHLFKSQDLHLTTECLVCTEKDAAKLAAIGVGSWVIPLVIDFDIGFMQDIAIKIRETEVGRKIAGHTSLSNL